MDEFDMNAGCLVWNTAIPYSGCPRTSPNFYIRESSVCFVLKHGLEKTSNKNLYTLHVEGQKHLYELSSIASYVKEGGNSFRIKEVTRGCVPDSLNEFHEIIYDDRYVRRAKERITIVIIFLGQDGSKLRLTNAKKKCFRDAAVGTSALSDAQVVVPDSKKSLSDAHSILEIMSSDFSKLLDEDLYQDVELHCEDDTFKAHRNVLSARSKVFRKMLQSNMLEGQTAQVELKDMKSDICKQLLYYMYSGKLPELTSENVRGFYEAGDRYNVGGLMKPCAEFLKKNLKPDNVCEMLVLADAHSDESFKESIIEYMLDKKIPLEIEPWQAFCRSQPLLANEVLNRYYWSQNKK